MTAERNSKQGWLMAAICAVFVIVLVVLSITADQRWNAQPMSVKAAAAKLEQQFKAGVQWHDFIRYKDGRLAVIEVPRATEGVELRDCHTLQVYPANFQDLARQGVTYIPKSAPNYKDAAVECIP